MNLAIGKRVYFVGLRQFKDMYYLYEYHLNDKFETWAFWRVVVGWELR